MKLWPPRFLAAARPQPTLDRKDEQHVEALGGTGTLNFDGFLQQSEYNPDLKGKQAIDTFDRMRRSDASVHETLWHLFAPILNADWTVESPQDATDQELEVTAFIEAAFFEWLDQPFTEYLTEALAYLTYGFAVFEPLFQVVERSLTVGETPTGGDSGGTHGNERDRVDTTAADFPPPKPSAPALPEIPPKKPTTIPPRQFVTWRKFAPRLQATIWKWNVDRDGELISVEQYAPILQPDGTQFYKLITIPAEYLLIYTNNKIGDEWSGTSVLRSVYKPWVFKELIEKIAGIAYERHGVGIPVAYVPRDREDDAAAIAKIEEMLSELRAGEASYLVFPGPKAQGNVLGYQFEIIGPQGGIPDFKTILEYFRGEIKGGLLARFSELGHASTGARATANVQAEVWYNALHAIARYIADRNSIAIRRLVDLNYPGVQRYPKLVASNIEARNLLEFAQAVALLMNSGGLSPDNPTKAWIRRTVDAPPEDPDEAQMRVAQAKAAQDLSLGGIEADPTSTAKPRASKSSTSTSTKST